ncbi:hypothetical protein M5K25_019225 [Dendrobium thyrsiflorum]|uniref:Uncharacterized protein n=1 Tax=Dendrobium thyrsiflorum TaxID=117978 RepID=A0ABD0UL40_DENTH
MINFRGLILARYLFSRSSSSADLDVKERIKSLLNSYANNEINRMFNDENVMFMRVILYSTVKEGMWGVTHTQVMRRTPCRSEAKCALRYTTAYLRHPPRISSSRSNDEEEEEEKKGGRRNGGKRKKEKWREEEEERKMEKERRKEEKEMENSLWWNGPCLDFRFSPFLVAVLKWLLGSCAILWAFFVLSVGVPVAGWLVRFPGLALRFLPCAGPLVSPAGCPSPMLARLPGWLLRSLCGLWFLPGCGPVVAVSLIPVRTFHVCCFVTSLLRMTDLANDHGFIYNDQGQVNIIKSPFFNFTPGVDQSVEEYVDRIIYQLAATIDEQISSVQWLVGGNAKKSTVVESLREGFLHVTGWPCKIVKEIKISYNFEVGEERDDTYSFLAKTFTLPGQITTLSKCPRLTKSEIGKGWRNEFLSKPLRMLSLLSKPLRVELNKEGRKSSSLSLDCSGGKLQQLLSQIWEEQQQEEKSPFQLKERKEKVAAENEALQVAEQKLFTPARNKTLPARFDLLPRDPATAAQILFKSRRSRDLTIRQRGKLD